MHEENNIGGGAEHPGSDEQKISQILSGLTRVEAPKDFDFHLKARIANGRPDDIRPASLFPILKYALPLVLFLFAGAAVFLNSSFQTGVEPDIVGAPDAAVSNETLASAAPVPVPTAAAAVEPAGQNFMAGPQPERVADVPRRPVVDRTRLVRNTSSGSIVPGGGSLTSTGGTSQEAITPKEFNLNSANTQPLSNQALPAKPEGVRETLRTMGVDVDLVNGTWTVRSVRFNSLGSSSGVRAGDKVEAINGLPVNAATVYKGSFRADTIKVKRDGASVDLKLQADQ